MRLLVDDVLDERRTSDRRRRKWTAGAVALTGHALLAAVIALAPAFAARRQTDVRDYMRVMIVPAKALGEASAPVQPKRTPPPKPKPAPVLAQPEPEAEPETKPARRSVEAPPQALPTSPSRAPAVTEQPTAAVADEAESTRRRGGPDGTTFGTSAFGSSEASFDDPNFMYGYYVQQMLAMIGGNWVRPRASAGTEMVVHFNISKQGQISDVEVVRESGNRAFDRAGYRAVSLSSPLPPLPQSYRSDSLGVNLLIR